MAPKKTATKRARSPQAEGTKLTSKRSKRNDAALSKNSGREDTQAVTETPETEISPTAAGPSENESSRNAAVADGPYDSDRDENVQIPFSGDFDIYSMNLPFLQSAFGSARDYTALYKDIQKYQKKPDNTGQAYLPEDGSFTDGRFASLSVCDPMSDEPFHFAITSVERHDISFTPGERNGCGGHLLANVASAPGVVGSIELEEEGCGVSGASGKFKMRQISTEDRELEMYEGFFSTCVSFSGLYARKGFGSSNAFSFPFWVIRARTGEDGKRVGLKALT